jgi:cytochrome P450
MSSVSDVGVEMLPTPEGIANPFPIYERLRDRSPLPGYRDWPPGTVPGLDEPVTAWALLRYDDVLAAVRDPTTFSSRDPIQEASPAPSLMLVNHDKPDHTKLRGLVNQAFSPRRIEHLGPWLDELTATLLEPLDHGEVDVMDGFAEELPTRAMVRLLGLSEADQPRMKRWANAFMLSADLTPEERNASNMEMFGALAAEVGARASAQEAGADAEDAPDLISALLRAEVEGERLTPEEVVRFCVTLVVAGSETTTYGIGNVLAALADVPGLFERLDADRERIPVFIEEALRLEGPQRLFRLVTRDVEIRGRHIAAGEWVALFFGAANRDPEMFPDPDRFDLDRPNSRKHLSWGLGVHFCLGAPLARLEMAAVVNAVLDRYRAVTRGEAAPVKQAASLLTHGYVELPLVFTPR